MSSTAARIRAALTAVGVVLAVAIVFVGLIVAAGSVVGFVWGTFFGAGDSPTGGPPTVDFETSSENGSVVLTHAGGEEVTARSLTISVAGNERGTWADHDGSGNVTEGDSIRIEDVSPGNELVVRWNGNSQNWVVLRETI